MLLSKHTINYGLSYKCGSTSIDQNSRHQLRCYNCGNISIWDAERFGISRNGNKDDVSRSGKYFSMELSSDEYDWHGAILTSILSFAHQFSDIKMVLGESFMKVNRKDFEDFVNTWQSTRTQIDKVIEKIVQRGDIVEQ
jgi:hypothetical protein